MWQHKNCNFAINFQVLLVLISVTVLFGKMTYTEEVTRSLKQTSVKGVPRMLKAELWKIKFVWGISILIFLSLGFYQSYELIADYTSYPVLTTIKETTFSTQKDNVFPPLDVCSSNPYGLLRKLSKNESLEYYLKLIKNVTTCNNCTNEEQSIFERTKIAMSSIYTYIRYLGVNKTVSLLENYTEFLVECLVFTVGGLKAKKCNMIAEIKLVPSGEYLLCLRFRFPQNTLIEAVSMTFYIDSFETDFLEYQSEPLYSVRSTGIAYFILNSHANLELEKSTAPSGFVTNVKIYKEVYSRLSKPYGNCVSSVSNYSYDDCYAECIFYKYYEYCNCAIPFSYGYEVNSTLNSKTFCLSLIYSKIEMIEKYKCIERFQSDMVSECTDQCKQSCAEVKYFTEVSYTRWPLTHQLDSFHSKYIRHTSYSHRFNGVNSNNRSSEDIATLRQLIEDNFVKIDFSLSKRAYKEYIQVPKYTIFTFVGALGGALNLWTGITVIVVVEFLEFVINVFINRKDI